MKSLWIKFKYWLIKKLGGYLPHDEFKVYKFNMPVQKYTQSLFIRAANEKDYEDQIKNELYRKMAIEVLPNICRITKNYKPSIDGFEYILTLYATDTSAIREGENVVAGNELLG